MRLVKLQANGDLDEWRNAARLLLSNDIAPEQIDWQQEHPGAFDIFGPINDRSPLDDLKTGSKPIMVPKDFIPLAEQIVCHTSQARFALLYRLLWRIQDDKKLLEAVSDEDVVLAHKLEKSVRRDSNKMKAFVRFKEIVDQQRPGTARRRFAAWFEPDHFIVERVAPFFQRRFTDMDWILATPKGSAAWDGQTLSFMKVPATKPSTEDATDDLWRIYFASIFNPARLKIKAMQTEMPKKYWKNLPEAELIPKLISEAEANVAAMLARQASAPPAFHSRLQAARLSDEPPHSGEGTLDHEKQLARACTRCDLYKNATQMVFGEGPEDAEIMFVGEQPGDQEDLAGRPFIGPAGKIFDDALERAGIARSDVYVTNAVKHFKYTPRGKRRIHQKPNMGEIKACRWWLDREITIIKPKIIVALGATALTSLTQRQQRLGDVRGKTISLSDEQTLFVTVHPSYLLRIPDPKAKNVETERFLNDIQTVKTMALTM
ncbi:UdgX family uracil-DNA binding protein [Phyllobacterium sp. 1468]|uniref:UdgX family uracil-DNA binding protein n=1 Tax=Phyllobacterium sp. 1468 TaxID=2817759 RepID=UPI00286C50AF|nr:UdgX family uracil-DNA binding protein [Phyllobacterium sp. 1468]